MICVRPIPNTGPASTWTRAGRDADRERDTIRCSCGQSNCRDREVTKQP